MTQTLMVSLIVVCVLLTMVTLAMAVVTVVAYLQWRDGPLKAEDRQAPPPIADAPVEEIQREIAPRPKAVAVAMTLVCLNDDGSVRHERHCHRPSAPERWLYGGHVWLWQKTKGSVHFYQREF